MNYLAALLGIALLGSITTAAVFRGNAEDWHRKYDDRVSQEATAAQTAKDAAAAEEAKSAADNRRQADNAIAQAQSKTEQAQSAMRAYQGKLKMASGERDLGHACSAVVIPADLIP